MYHVKFHYSNVNAAEVTKIGPFFGHPVYYKL